eukprot:747631-Hanusia_phi.AAC.1
MRRMREMREMEDGRDEREGGGQRNNDGEMITGHLALYCLLHASVALVLLIALNGYVDSSMLAPSASLTAKLSPHMSDLRVAPAMPRLRGGKSESSILVEIRDKSLSNTETLEELVSINASAIETLAKQIESWKVKKSAKGVWNKAPAKGIPTRDSILNGLIALHMENRQLDAAGLADISQFALSQLCSDNDVSLLAELLYCLVELFPFDVSAGHWHPPNKRKTTGWRANQT